MTETANSASDADIDALRSKRREVAKEALYAYLDDHPDEPLNVMWDHFFPPSPLPFSREDLRSAFVNEWHSGRLDLTVDRRVRRTENDGSRA